ncbi:MAG: sigma-70 family RNA polymerase sigma factor [Kiritimatiellae bacterium]|nr:sigma-70 family RNA polymerase sigma factor [Kiritimatiellia bacterium]
MDRFEEVSKLLVEAQFELRVHIHALTMDPSLVDDALGRVNAWILAHFAEYDASRPFLPWARAVAWWQMRSEKTDRMREGRFVVFDSELAAKIDAAAETPAEDSRAAALAVMPCLERLPKREREVLRMKYLAGYSAQEISEMKGTSVAAVYSLLARARAMLRTGIEKMTGRKGL